MLRRAATESRAQLCMHKGSLHQSIAYSLPHVAVIARLSKIAVQVDAVRNWQPLLEQKHLYCSDKHESDRNSATHAANGSQTPNRRTADMPHSIAM